MERHQPPTWLVLLEQQAAFAEMEGGGQSGGSGADDDGAPMQGCLDGRRARVPGWLVQSPVHERVHLLRRGFPGSGGDDVAHHGDATRVRRRVPRPARVHRP